jgi:prophage tail gpP-like protein
MARKPDSITVETDAGVFDRFESLTVVNDLLGVTEATFQLGDDGAWPELRDALEPGSSVRVALNGRPRMTGRAEVNAVPISAADGAKISLTVRTIMADARYSSADPALRVEKTSIMDFVLAAYAELGVTADKFDFFPGKGRDLMTGLEGGKGAPVDLEPIKVDQAKVNPPETIYEAVERHLRRHRCTHWERADGLIIVGTPDTAQAPSYRFRAKRGAASVGNNVTKIERVRDYSELALFVQILGNSPGKDVLRAGIRGTATDNDVAAVVARTSQFNRRVLIPRQQVKDQAQANAQAARELTLRRMRKNAVEVNCDGWTYWTGQAQIPYANNTAADIDVDALGGTVGRYLVTKVALSLSVGGGATTTLTCVGVDDFVL